MTNKQQITYAFAKLSSIGKAQSRYALASIAFAALGYVGTEVSSLSFAVNVAPVGIALTIMAWFGVARASGQISAKLKTLIPDYNYGLYGGAPPFIWALAYSAHGQGGLQRIMALASFPLVFSLLLGYGIYVDDITNLVDNAIICAIPIYQVAGLWKNRIKTMVK